MSEKFSIQNQEQERKELLRSTTAYINAGGRGTRLESVLPKTEKGIAKALIPFGDNRILEYHVKRLHRVGFGKVIVGAGDHEEISAFVKATWPDAENTDVTTFDQQEGTGGDLIKTVRSDNSLGERVVVQNVDTLLDVDEAAVVTEHAKHGGATIVLTGKKGVPNQDAFYVDKEGRVIFNEEATVQYTEAPVQAAAYRASSTGMVIFDTSLLDEYPWEPGDKPLSLYKDVLGKIAADGKLWAYHNGDNFFVDIGTPEQYQKILRHPILKKILEERSNKE